MGRNRGTFEFSANFEPTNKEPIEGNRVSLYSDLVLYDTWKDSKGNTWLYDGKLAIVSNDPDATRNGLYFLKSGTGYTSASNWEKVGISGFVIGSDSKIVYTNNSTPMSSDVFDINNPPVDHDDSLMGDDKNLYISQDSTHWVFNASTGGYETKVVTNQFGMDILAAPQKPTIHDNDKFGFADSEDTYKTKSVKWSTFKAWFLDFFRSQIEISGSVTIHPSWHGKLIIVTAPATITVPATLSANHAWEGYSMTGATVAWAITSPKTWENGTPTATPEKTTFAFFQRGSTNSVILLQ